MNILLSGLIGALFATMLSVVYQYASEQAKYRGDLLIEVVNWLDAIYVRLQAMQIHKEGVYNSKELSLNNEEYRNLSKEVRKFLLSDKITSLVALTYGEGRKLQLANALKGEMTKAAEILWASNEENWKQSCANILDSFKNKIDPIKIEALNAFLEGAKIYSVMKDAFKVIFPTFCKVFRI
ncbi:MAG: hypothetical protein P9X22_03070 [Candidatus Zapsychrus exili]|nr:hypothetical protein [Candidatus Zapsychrus exili]